MAAEPVPNTEMSIQFATGYSHVEHDGPKVPEHVKEILLPQTPIMNLRPAEIAAVISTVKHAERTRRLRFPPSIRFLPEKKMLDRNRNVYLMPDHRRELMASSSAVADLVLRVVERDVFVEDDLFIQGLRIEDDRVNTLRRFSGLYRYNEGRFTFVQPSIDFQP